MADEAEQVDPIRKRKRREMEAKAQAHEEASQSAQALVSPHPVIGTPRGRVVLGRGVRLACPLYPEQIDPDGTVHPQLYVDFRTDARQKYLDERAVLEELSKVERAEGEEEDAYRARRVEALAHRSVESWCRQLARRVIGFDGWDFIDSVTGELIPQPSPLEWESYTPLVIRDSDLLDLGLWCVNAGWNAALDISAKN